MTKSLNGIELKRSWHVTHKERLYMKVEDIEKKIKVHKDSISKLEKELEKEQSLIPVFVSPALNISKAMENCLGWQSIAEDNEYTVIVDEYDIYCFYWGINDSELIKWFLRNELSASCITDKELMFNWFDIDTECARGIYKFTPHKDNTYSVTPLTINKDYTLSEV